MTGTNDKMVEVTFCRTEKNYVDHYLVARMPMTEIQSVVSGGRVIYSYDCRDEWEDYLYSESESGWEVVSVHDGETGEEVEYTQD